MTEFSTFKTVIQRQFHAMKDKNLYRAKVDKDLLWSTYLNSFPPGTNPMHKERTEFDCSACKSFVKTIGALVAVTESNELVSLWDIEIGEPFQSVANALSELVKSSRIENIYLHSERTAGVDKNIQLVNGETIIWHHFFVQLPNALYCAGHDIGTHLGEAEATFSVFNRGLSEITIDALETTLELMTQGSLYRGEEHKSNVDAFYRLKKRFDKLDDKQKDAFCWEESRKAQGPVSRIRNTSIGTLLTDLSEGKDLELSVSSFESKVAPTNYRRPTALITGRMIEQAKQKVEELGLIASLGRRFATIDDVSINNLLFADRDTKKPVTGNAFDELIGTSGVSSKSLSKTEEVPIEKFVSDILPRISAMEVLFENSHSSNLVSLIAPEDFTAKPLFKWGNAFSWAYNGDVADSIKERVKSAGGRIDGDLRISLSWSNHDDLDLHVIEPGGFEIFYGDKRSQNTGGNLDVDMNAGGRMSRTPVENIAYPKRTQMREGIYTVTVNQFNVRETTNIGFDLEIEFDGVIHSFSYPKALRREENVAVAKLNYTHKEGFKLIESLPSSQSVKIVWNIPTCTFHKVSALMLSPNFWDSMTVGNKHYFFMLEGALSDGPARGFFNEFLSEELNPHRKVLEQLGAKFKTQDSDNQLSGLGFSSTQRNSLIARVSGNFTRTIKIIF